MRYYNSVMELVGRTPLVRLNRLVDADMATVLVKMEHLNPSGSVKDRMAVNMIRRAEEAGLLKPGGTIVESTSGNTGMGLAMTAAAKGYRCICTIPDKMSQEKIDMLKAYGAEVIITPTALPHDHPDSYVEVARRIARETPNAFYTDQYSNMSNPEAHYLTTGPEIWEDTGGNFDALVGGIGTGGTISGTARYIREQCAKAGRKPPLVACPDPVGSMYFDVFYKKTLRPTRVYSVEGIGHDFMVDTLDLNVIDEVIEVTDRDSFITARRLAREEGIFCGGSTGTALWGALQVARRLGPGKVVVCLLADAGGRYVSKFFNDEWMKDKGFFDPEDRFGQVRDVLSFKGGAVEFARADETIAAVATRMSEMGISQMPLREQAGAGLRMVHESDLLHSLVSGKAQPADTVEKVAADLEGQVGLTDSVVRVQRILDSENVAVVVDQERIVGIISKIDVVRFLAARSNAPRGPAG